MVALAFSGLLECLQGTACTFLLAQLLIFLKARLSELTDRVA